jgi:toxin ParE1/3/4
MEVRWSIPAVEDLERIFQHIERDNPTAARDVVKTIYDGCEALKNFPHRGRPGRMAGRRELVFPPLPYIVVYQVKQYAVEISRVYHAAQDWP